MLDFPVVAAAAPRVAAAQPEDAQRAIDALTLAFAADPPSRWLFPDGRQYLRYFPSFAKAFGGAAIERGTALASHDCCGVALWLAPGVGPDEEALAALIEQSVAKARQADLFRCLTRWAGSTRPSRTGICR